MTNDTPSCEDMAGDSGALASGTGPAPSGLSPCGSQAEPLVPSADVAMLTPERQPYEPFRTYVARIIALHGLGTVSGANRWCPPTLEWETAAWAERVLECIPYDAEQKCFLLADVLIAASAIEARSDATGTGAAEGESAAGDSRDAQGATS